METIKSYTNLEQSKKLAEILPLESADMYWKNGVSNKYIQCFTPFVIDDYRVDADFDYDIPCWSLAGLLGVLPKKGLVDLRFLQSTFDNRGNHLTNVWCCTFEDIGTVTLDLYANNPVDACVDMIEKLYELKML